MVEVGLLAVPGCDGVVGGMGVGKRDVGEKGVGGKGEAGRGGEGERGEEGEVMLRLQSWLRYLFVLCILLWPKADAAACTLFEETS